MFQFTQPLVASDMKLSPTCPSTATLALYHAGLLNLDPGVRAHIDDCSICQATLVVFHGESHSIDQLRTRHLNDEQIEKFLSNRLSRRGRHLADCHLIICHSCRDKVAAARQTVQSRQEGCL